MIQMVLERGVYYPRVFCDFCGERITETGIVTTKNDIAEGEAAALIFLHKGDCDHSYGREGGAHLGWIELHWLPLQLLLNIREFESEEQLIEFIHRQLHREST